MFGALIQGLVQGDPGAYLIGILFFGVGYAVLAIAGWWQPEERRAFGLSYTLCVIIGALAQWYALSAFGSPQSTLDAHTFSRLIDTVLPAERLEYLVDISNAPLSVLVWRWLFGASEALHLTPGPHVGIMFNALTIGLAGAVSVRTAREVFGDGRWRLRRVGTLFAVCGMFWLFGGLLLRDGHATLVLAILLWSLARWLAAPTLSRFLAAVVVSGLCAWTMFYIRWETTALFVVYWLLAMLVWLRRRPAGGLQLVAFGVVLVGILAGSAFVSQTVGQASALRGLEADRYAAHGAETNAQGSLGMRLVVNQPLPVRLVLGTGTLMIYPIPLWAGLEPGSSEYALIKGYHGFYQVIVMPLAIVGVFAALVQLIRGRREFAPIAFLAAALLAGIASVAVTSLETRHVAQFLPAFIILAAYPDTRRVIMRRRVRSVGLLWVALVLVVHLAWAVMKGVL